ncbi:cell envelope biogenesis protein OmpA [Rahnella aceris]|uniref:cell envelope biogenesis protein OmpA n=1 Tax=Rahnella sp. (strain Y9602) TaxID=2703885 RepID=UPI001C25A296|nr:cell envelope biogenesis protein OmpA [Rahnella aceris]MBU9866787.1 cell envelope biogenesis protein OmpA [Rahnella aceris]
MANFSKEQIQQQINAHFIREGVESGVAMTLAMRGADHYCSTSNATVVSSIAHAKTFLKSTKRIKGAPDIKRNQGRGRR